MLCHRNVLYVSGLRDVLNSHGYETRAVPPSDLHSCGEVVDAYLIELQDMSWLSDSAAGPHEVPWIALLDAPTSDSIRFAFASGAIGLIHSNMSGDLVPIAVECALRGEPCIPLDVFRSILSAARPQVSDYVLDETDIEILGSLSEGMTVVDLSSRLGYSERTMHNHLARLYRRLGVKNRYEAITRVAAVGLLDSNHATGS